MKIKITQASARAVLEMPKEERLSPKKPNILFRTLLKLVCLPDVLATRHKLSKINMDKLDKKQPCLYLMNHSCFLDLKIMLSAIYPRPINIVCTHDGLVGKRWLMKNLGCFPTRKYVSDIGVVKDIKHCLTKLNTSVLMYPEGGYSFDGRCTKLPDSLGKCLKFLGAPVVIVKTYGAFHRDPLYNNLQLRKIKVETEMKYLLSPEDINKMSASELNELLRSEFDFDSFRWQQQNGVVIDEKFRADYLHRVLYKCPHCMAEDKMHGEGEYITCGGCGKKYLLTETGWLEEAGGDTVFNHVPDWFDWQRSCVREELLNGSYRLDTEVEVYMLKGTKSLYRVGFGRLTHDVDGFYLTACDGEIDFKMSPLTTYTLNADYNWYEIGDVISIGDGDVSYYCFPKDSSVSVTKARLATEELYEIKRAKLKTP